MSSKWDAKLEFDATKSLLLERLANSRTECLPDENGFLDPSGPIRLAHYNIMMIQLGTTSRASEAVDMFLTWGKTGSRVITVRIRKRSPKCLCGHIKSGGRSPTAGHAVVSKGVRGACKTPGCVDCKTYRPDPNDVKMRVRKVPVDCLDSDLVWLKPVAEKGLSIDSYITFCRRHLKNSHSFRYAAITELHRRKVPFEEIAKITGHANPMQVFTYLQSRDAEKAADELAGIVDSKGN